MVKIYNNSPYHDDYDESKRFHQIMFRPGYAIQARELNQLQTILQHQIERHGSYFFNDGAIIVPENRRPSIELKTTAGSGTDFIDISNTGDILNDIVGKTITNTVGSNESPLEADVFQSKTNDNTGITRLYLRYKTTGENDKTKFAVGDTQIRIKSETTDLVITGVGTESTAHILDCVVYARGYFVFVEEQFITLGEDVNPDKKIGFDVKEDIIDEVEDTSLFDNAQGVVNNTAPGAHRSHILLTLTSRDLDDTSSDFIEIARSSQQEVINKTDTTDLNREFLETLARRTFDESGNYIVDGLQIQDIREHRKNDRGAWTGNTAYKKGDFVSQMTFTVGSEDVERRRRYVAMKDFTSSGNEPNWTAARLGDETDDGTTSDAWEYNPNPYSTNGLYPDGDEDKFIIRITPGKAYVKGFEFSSDDHLREIVLDKARTGHTKSVQNAFINTRIGNYFELNDVVGLPPLGSDGFDEVHFYNTTGTTGDTSIPAATNRVASARVAYIEKSSGGNSEMILGFFDVKFIGTNTDLTNVRKVCFGTPGTNTSTNFTATIGGADFNPFYTYCYVLNSDSDRIYFPSSERVPEIKIGDVITRFRDDFTARTVTAVDIENVTTGDRYIEVNAPYTIPGSRSNGYITGIHTQDGGLKEPQNTSFVFPVVENSSRKIEKINEITYTTSRKITNGTVTIGQIVLNLPTTADNKETFDGVNVNDYIVMKQETTKGTHLTLESNKITISSSNKRVTIRHTSIAPGDDITVIAPIRKTAVIPNSGYKETTKPTGSTTGNAMNREITLGHADVKRIISILQGPSGNQREVKNNYILNTGERDTYYNLSRIRARDGVELADENLDIKYEYYDRENYQKFFTIDAYTENGSLGSADTYLNAPYHLRDVIDFRPTVSPGSTVNRDNGREFEGNTAFISDIPTRSKSATTQTNYVYYQGRFDKVVLTDSLTLEVIKGTPADQPRLPPDRPNAITLFEVYIPPFTESVDDIRVSTLKHPRYTMKDIQRLDKKIDRLEGYTTLSLLELDTQHFNVLDENGLNRFKNGFIVENFRRIGYVGDITSSYYKSALDVEKGELRPSFVIENIGLKYKDGTRDFVNDIITMEYEDASYVKQLFFSTTENVNPYHYTDFQGVLRITPSTDSWVDKNTDVVENEIIDDSGLRLLPSTGVNTPQNEIEWYSGGRFHLAGYFRNISGTRRYPTATKTILSQRTSLPYHQIIEGEYEQIGEETTEPLEPVKLPYVRSRNILCSIVGLKPNTRFYVFMDDTDVTSNCTPSQTFKTTNQSTDLFDVGDRTEVDNDGREIPTDPAEVDNDALVTGDVIWQGSESSPTATAVVVGRDGTGANIEVVNVRGTFSTTQNTDLSSSSGATAVLSEITDTTPPTTLTSNSRGELYFLLFIPKNAQTSFTAGRKNIIVTDTNNLNNLENSTSMAEGTYDSEGIQNRIQVTTVKRPKTRTANFIQYATRYYFGSALGYSIDDDLQPITIHWRDPLAQSFLVTQIGGIYASKIELYFDTKPTDNIPVRLEIRNMVNGVPGNEILAYSQVVVYPDDVHITPTSPGSLPSPTIFKFDNPVYLKNERRSTEYCFVLHSDSNGYNLHISHSDDIPAGKTPYLGQMYRSENNTAWHIARQEDITFELFRAKFSTKTSSGAKQSTTVRLVNKTDNLRQQLNNPFTVTSGSNEITVFQRNHGHKTNDKVTISGVSGTDFAGILVRNINKTHTITGITSRDKYTISITDATANDAADNATSTVANGGNEGIIATRNIRFDQIFPTLTYVEPEDTEVSITIKTTPVSTGTLDATGTNIVNENENLLANEKYIKSIPNLSGTEDSIEVELTLSSNNDYLSPSMGMSGDAPNASLKTTLNAINETVTDITNADGADASYITKPIILENESTFLNIRVGMNVPHGTGVKIYRKTGLVSAGNIENTSFVEITPDLPIATTPANSNRFDEISYNVSDLAPFDIFEIRIIMTSSNTAVIPRLRDLRIIAGI